MNVHEAKTHLSRLLERALEAEEAIIMRAGRQLVRLPPMENAPARRKLGTAKGDFIVPEDFAAPVPDEIFKEFESIERFPADPGRFSDIPPGRLPTMPGFSQAHRNVYLDPASDLYLSLASVWEMLIKSGIGKLPIPCSRCGIHRQFRLRINRVNPLPVRMPHLKELEALRPVHCDPFDRMLIAQARAEGMSILSADPQMRECGVTIL